MGILLICEKLDAFWVVCSPLGSPVFFSIRTVGKILDPSEQQEPLSASQSVAANKGLALLTGTWLSVLYSRFGNLA